MKVIFEKPEFSTIELRNCSDSLYYVAMEQERAVASLTRQDFDEGPFLFRCFDGITRGNEYDSPLYETVQEAIKWWCESTRYRAIHAFKSKQEAFKFISENI